MNIKIKWVNKNLNEDGVRVYKSAAPIDPYNLPEPIATLPGGSTYFNDASIIRGNTYYYRVESFRGGDKSISDQISVLAQQRTGVGGQNITLGDSEMGIYGTVNSNNFFYVDEIARLSGVNVGESLINSNIAYFKLAYKGSVIFLPQMPIMRRISWMDLYNRGLVYPNGDGGEYWNGLNVTTNRVQQGKTIKKNGETYKVRLMSGRNDEGTSVRRTLFEGFYQASNCSNSEWNNVLYRIFPNYTFYDFQGYILSNNNYPHSTVGASANNGGCWTSNIQNTTSAIVRGGSHNTSAISYPMHGASMTMTDTSDLSRWWPILEYVPSDEVEANIP